MSSPDGEVRLPKDFDPAYTGTLVKKEESTELLAEGVRLLAEYQERLAAQDAYGLLVIFQAMDAAGKDGTIRHVMSGVNPQGVRGHVLQGPVRRKSSTTTTSGARRRACPLAGSSGSSTAPTTRRSSSSASTRSSSTSRSSPTPRAARTSGSAAIREINDWERYLVDQRHPHRQALPQRLEGGAAGALPGAHRRAGEELEVLGGGCARTPPLGRLYQRAFSDVLSATSTEHAPWHVIPADRKWFMRVAASGVIIDKLMTLDPQWPTVDAARLAEMAEARDELLAEGPRPDQG